MVVQLIWVVVGCGGDGQWWLSMLLWQWILVVGGCTIDVVADNGEKIIYCLMYSKYYFNV